MNHFERIPWISHHPLYIKKGTFCSELSRVATLSSQFDDFANACREVAEIYIARGYPVDLIRSWLRNNYQARWEARLREFSPPAADVLVLKSEFNISWDYFNVHLLEERMKQAWTVALQQMSRGDRTATDLHREVTSAKDLPMALEFWPWWRSQGYAYQSAPGEVALAAAHTDNIGSGIAGRYFRVDKLGFLDRRLIVSKKRTAQLIDLCAVWRKTVLLQRDRRVLDDDGPVDEPVVEPVRRTVQSTLDSWLRPVTSVPDQSSRETRSVASLRGSRSPDPWLANNPLFGD